MTHCPPAKFNSWLFYFLLLVLFLGFFFLISVLKNKRSHCVYICFNLIESCRFQIRQRIFHSEIKCVYILNQFRSDLNYHLYIFLFLLSICHFSLDMINCLPFMSFYVRKPWLKSGQLDGEVLSLSIHFQLLFVFCISRLLFCLYLSVWRKTAETNHFLLCSFRIFPVFRFMQSEMPTDWQSLLLSFRRSLQVRLVYNLNEFSFICQWILLSETIYLEAIFHMSFGEQRANYVPSWTRRVCIERGEDFLRPEKLFTHCGAFWWLSVIWRRQTTAPSTFETRTDLTLGAECVFESCLIFDYHNNGTEQLDSRGDVFDIIRTIVSQTPP